MDEKKVEIPFAVWKDCKYKMAMAAELYTVALELIDGTDAGREVAKLGLDRMAALIQDVYGDLFM